MNDAQCRAYLARLGLQKAPPPDRTGLAALHYAHLTHIPFENLDIHLGRPLSLEVDALYEKLVERRHGGFCYELNGLFAELLEHLGFSVTRMAARVAARDTGELGPPRDHLCLRVRFGEPLLCDVGFGRGFLRPLRMVETAWQNDGRDEYRIEAGAPEWSLFDRSRLLYCFDPEPLQLADFAEMCRYHQTSPDSPFPKGRVWTMATEEGRVTMRGEMFVEERGSERTERPASDADWLGCRPGGA